MGSSLCRPRMNRSRGIARRKSRLAVSESEIASRTQPRTRIAGANLPPPLREVVTPSGLAATPLTNKPPSRHRRYRHSPRLLNKIQTWENGILTVFARSLPDEALIFNRFVRGNFVSRSRECYRLAVQQHVMSFWAFCDICRAISNRVRRAQTSGGICILRARYRAGARASDGTQLSGGC